MRRAGAAVLAGLVPVALACGGATPSAPTPEVPALIHPVENGDKCEVTRLPGKEVLATFEGPCQDWSLSVSPEDPANRIIGMTDKAPQHNGAPLPDLPEGDLDVAGFDEQGAIVAFVSTYAEPVLDERRETAFVKIDGKKVSVDFHDAQMFSVLLCSAHSQDGDAWKRVAGPTPVQLYEGMSSPYCPGMEGGPELAELHHPDLEDGIETPMGEAEDPEALKGIETVAASENNSWYPVTGQPLAIQGFWFEGLMFNTPIAVRRGDTWSALPGLEKPEQPLTARIRDRYLVACTPTESFVYDSEADFAQVFRGSDPCPILESSL